MGKAQQSPRFAFMQRFEVPSVEHPLEAHFVRWRVIQTPLFGIYVHRFDNPDVRTFHDHPWNFISLVLKGGYAEALSQEPIEDNPTQYRTVRAGRFNIKRATDLHFIASLLRRPTWTVLVVGRRQRVWGYVDETGWTQFDQHPNNDKFHEAWRLREEASVAE
jgi:hypothetical protein